MSLPRHYWLPRHVWLGTEATIAPGAVLAFATEHEARVWASEVPDSIGAKTARRIWRVTIRPNVRTYRVTKVPATTAMDVQP